MRVFENEVRGKVLGRRGMKYQETVCDSLLKNSMICAVYRTLAWPHQGRRDMLRVRYVRVIGNRKMLTEFW
jgi:hypothetical protein